MEQYAQAEIKLTDITAMIINARFVPFLGRPVSSMQVHPNSCHSISATLLLTRRARGQVWIWAGPNYRILTTPPAYTKKYSIVV